MNNITLNHAQEKALVAIRDKHKQGINTGVVVLPTGVGKTYLSAIDAQKNGKKILYLAHQEQILRQAKKSFEKLTNFDTGFYISKQKDISEATFATVQSMTRNCLSFPRNMFDYIIVDECHHSQTKSYRKIINHFQPKYLLGLTATPYRRDNQDIFKIVGKPYYQMKIREAIEENLLAKINYYYVDNDIDFTAIKQKFGRYDEKDLNKKLLIPKYDKAILKEYMKHSIGKKTIVFCVSIEHAKRLKRLFDKNKLGSSIAHSGMKKEDVYKNIGEFFAGKTMTIFVRDLFNEGIDVPTCDCIMLLRPTESKVIFEQQLGRGLRITKKKKEVLILDFTANSFNNKLNIEFLDKLSKGEVSERLYEEVNKERREQKEIIIYNNIGSVRLNRTKINILEQFPGNIEARKKLLTQSYFDLEKRLGRRPIASDMNTDNVPRHFGRQAYEFTFGSWEKFNESINRPNKRQRGQVIKQLKEFYAKHKRYPTTRDLRKYHLISDNTIRRVFGNYENALIEAGGNDAVHLFRNISKERLMKDFLEIKKELGRTPFSRELQPRLPYHFQTKVRYHYGNRSYHSFLNLIGVKPAVKPNWHYMRKNSLKREESKNE